MKSSNATLPFDTLTFASIAVNLVLSLPTNGYVVWLIATGAGGTMVASEFFPLNLAAFEILYCFVSVSRILRSIFHTLKFLSRFTNGFLWSGRPLLQCCICIEQFLAVVHPVLFLRFKPLRYKAAFSGAIWVVIIALSVFYTLTHKERNLVFVSECVILISVMLFCYFSVLVALKRPRPGEKGKTERDKSLKRKAFLIILTIIVSFVGTYLFWCVAILSNLNSWKSQSRRIFIKACTCITFASGFVQPLLYLQKIGKFSCRKAV